jgi:hypothetical protein
LLSQPRAMSKLYSLKIAAAQLRDREFR